MMWKAKPRPKIGDIRVRRKFAWLPMEFSVCDIEHYVWLETYQVTEQFEEKYVFADEGYYRKKSYWQIVKQEPLY